MDAARQRSLAARVRDRRARRATSTRSKAWVDRFGTWRKELSRKSARARTSSSELLEGRATVRARRRPRHAAGATADDCWRRAADDARRSVAAKTASRAAAAHRRARCAARWRAHADRSARHALRARSLRRARSTASGRASAPGTRCSRDPPAPTRRAARRSRSRGAAADIAAMGFDVLYLPPIHPIGRSFRKGRNNTLDAPRRTIRQPVGDRIAGGRPHRHRPGLGTLDDFDRFVAAAERARPRGRARHRVPGSPDHPWVAEHPEWFRHRPDGTIKYAENPPKKYQDIYPFDFEIAPTGQRCGTNCATSSVLDRRAACASSASTTRTPSRSASGSG